MALVSDRVGAMVAKQVRLEMAASAYYQACAQICGRDGWSEMQSLFEYESGEEVKHAGHWSRLGADLGVTASSDPVSYKAPADLASAVAGAIEAESLLYSAMVEMHRAAAEIGDVAVCAALCAMSADYQPLLEQVRAIAKWQQVAQRIASTRSADVRAAAEAAR